MPTQLGVSAVAVIVGVVMLATGMANVRTRRSEESGGRRLVNRAAGRSNTYTGSRAVAQGYLRIAIGVAAIAFGLVFAFTGPFAS